MRDRAALRPLPGTPTDQAWIESLFSHIKADWPHLDRITDPAVLRAELATVRHEYNTPQACMPASATSPPTTSTKAAAPRSAKPAASACHRARRLRIAHNRAQRQEQP